MSEEREKWILVDWELLQTATWTIRRPPALIDEPVPEVEVEEDAGAEAEAAEVPESALEWPGITTARRPGRMRPRRSQVLGALLVLLLAGGVGGFVAFLVRGGSGVAERADPPVSNPVAKRVVVVDPKGVRHACTIVGTPGADELRATGSGDTVCGLGGDDVILGGPGADLLFGGRGNDTLVGGPGADRLYGNSGKDVVRARDGWADRIDGGPGADRADVGWLDRSTRVERLSDPVIAAAGDIACDPLVGTFQEGVGTAKRCHQRYTAAVVERLEPDAVLVLGDAQYEDARYWKYLRSFDPTWGRFKRISHPTPASTGDAYGRGGFARYWGRRARPEGDPWYSFDLAGWHIVSLTSNCKEVGSCDPGSPQEQWLRADLAAHPAKCTLAFWHEPRFSSSRNFAPKMEPIWQALYDSGAELVLSADAHNYERFRPQDAAGGFDPDRGLRQFVVGTGGKSHQPIERPLEGSVKRNAKTFGVLELRLQRRSYTWRFVPEPGGRFTETGTARCH